MAKSVVRAPSSKKGRKVRAPDELASEYQRNVFFEALLQNFIVVDACKKAGFSVAAFEILKRDDKEFARRYAEAKAVDRELTRRQIHEMAFGKNGRSPSEAMLKLKVQMDHPDLIQQTAAAAVVMSLTPEQIKAMTTEELAELREKIAKRR